LLYYGFQNKTNATHPYEVLCLQLEELEIENEKVKRNLEVLRESIATGDPGTKELLNQFRASEWELGKDFSTTMNNIFDQATIPLPYATKLLKQCKAYAKNATD